MWVKMNYKVGYTLVRFWFPDNSPCPETQNKMVSSSNGVKVMACGLDHSGSQPFDYYAERTHKRKVTEVYKALSVC